LLPILFEQIEIFHPEFATENVEISRIIYQIMKVSAINS